MLVHGAKCSSFTIMLLKLWNVYNFLGLFFFHRRRKKYIIRGHCTIVFYWRSTIKQLYKRTQMIITPQITTQSQKTIHTMCIFIKIPEKWTEILKKKKHFCYVKECEKLLVDLSGSANPLMRNIVTVCSKFPRKTPHFGKMLSVSALHVLGTFFNIHLTLIQL